MECTYSSKQRWLPLILIILMIEELYYIRRNICGKPFRFDAISDVDIYKVEPWDLPSYFSYFYAENCTILKAYVDEVYEVVVLIIDWMFTWLFIPYESNMF